MPSATIEGADLIESVDAASEPIIVSTDPAAAAPVETRDGLAPQLLESRDGLNEPEPEPEIPAGIVWPERVHPQYLIGIRDCMRSMQRRVSAGRSQRDRMLDILREELREKLRTR